MAVTDATWIDANERLRRGIPISLRGVPVQRDTKPEPADGFFEDWPPGPPGGGDGRRRRHELPVIKIGVDEDRVNDQAVAALTSDPNVFERGGMLVSIAKAEKGDERLIREPDAPTIRPLPRAVLQERMAAAAQWVSVKQSKDGEWTESPAHPPDWSVSAVLERGAWPGVRHLEGIVEQPVLRLDGSVVDAAGYDASSGIVLIGEQMVKVPAQPTSDDVASALALLAEVVCDFPFARPEHRSAWLASVLTPLARYAFRGPAPCFLVDANGPGVGKGKIVDVATLISTGRCAPLSSYTPDDAEMDKRITTWASAGRPVVVLDNVSGRFGTDSLCRALTGTTYSGRVLGMTKDWVGPMFAVWFATANNVELGDDMSRRICHIRLLSTEEDPSKRTGFAHKDLIAHVRENRTALARAALTILRGYCAAGRPEQNLPAWGSYEGWTSIVRNAIVWAGWPDPAATREELQKSADPKARQRRALVLAWKEVCARFGGAATVKQGLEFVLGGDGKGPLPHVRELLEEVSPGKDGKVSAVSLGRLLRSLRDKVFQSDTGEPLILDSGGEDRNGVQRWKVRGPASPAEPPPAAGVAGVAGVSANPTRGENQKLLSFGAGENPRIPSIPRGECQDDPVDDGYRSNWDDDGRSR